jgi:hypothetical protein
MPWYFGDIINSLIMVYPEEIFEEREEVALNTNEVIPDYQFYLKMYTAHQMMDFESPKAD